MRKQFKILPLLLTLILLFASYPNFTLAAASKSNAVPEEVTRAISYGFVPDAIQNDLNKTITFTQYSTMLSKMISLYNKSYLPVFKKSARLAFSSKEAMKREDGMLEIYYAALAMKLGTSEENFANGDWQKIHQLCGEKVWEEISWNYPCFPNWDKSTNRFNGNYMINAYFFGMAQYSMVSGKTLFDFDEKANTMHVNQTFTRKAAICSVARLYESVKEPMEHQQTKWDNEFFKLYENRLNAILNSETTIQKSTEYILGKTYTGTAYYVSSINGNDDNDGLSPQTALASIERLHHVDLKPGDAVFFERGSLWRSEYLYCRSGITYSAYGQGEKPRFYGSPENGASEDKWELSYTGKNGEKIWTYYKNIGECGGVIFNEGKAYAPRVYGWWNGKQYVCFDNPSKTFNVNEALNKDLQFACEIDYSGNDFPIHAYDLNLKGKLYLRCDAGNPGAIYQSIEFETSDVTGWMGILSGCDSTGYVVDNLCVRYYGKAGIQTSPEMSNNIVQNCEVGWGGNCIHCYMQPTPTKDYMLSGDGIYGFCDGCQVINNYSHDIDGAGITYESSGHSLQIKGNYTCTGNLVERCGQGIRLADYLNSVFQEISVDNNYILYSGYGNTHGCWCDIAGIDLGTNLTTGTYKNIHVGNNVIYLSKEVLINQYSRYEEVPTVFDGNTYVQNINGQIASWYWKKVIANKGTLNTVSSLLGDKKGTVIY